MEQFKFLGPYFDQMSNESRVAFAYAWTMAQSDGSECLTTHHLLAACLEEATVERLLTSRALTPRYLINVKDRLDTYRKRFSSEPTRRKIDLLDSSVSPVVSSVVHKSHRFWEDHRNGDEHLLFSPTSLVGGILCEGNGIAMSCLYPLTRQDYSHLFRNYYSQKK